jgi:hypothetical protein
VLAGLLELRRNPKIGKTLAGKYREFCLFKIGRKKIVYDFNAGQNIILVVDVGKDLDI